MALLYKDSLAPAWFCRMEARATTTGRSAKRGATGATTSLYPGILCLSAQALLGILVAYCSIMKLNTALLGLVMLGSFACGSEGLENIVSPTEADAIVARTSAGIPELGSGGCDPLIANWKVDLAASQLTGDICLDTGPLHIERALTAEELAGFRSDLSAVVPVERTSCYFDAGGQSVLVKKGDLETSYFEGRTPCGDLAPNFVQAKNVKPIITRLKTLR